MRKAIAAGVLAALVSGCASIIDGGSQPMSFTSVPETASITITNRAGVKIHNGVTPATVTLKRGSGYFKAERYTVHVVKDGYQPMDIAVTSSVNGWYFGNIVLGGLIGMLIVDPITGAMYNLSPEAVNASLSDVSVVNNEGERSLTIMLAENVPADVMKHARQLTAN